MAKLGHYDAHPRYPNQAFLVLQGAKCRGESVPNTEAEIDRDVPWFANGVLEGDERGVNAAGVLFDWLTDDVFGRGFAESRLDFTSWDAQRIAIDEFRISPLITDAAEFKGRVASLVEYTDLFLRLKDGGSIELGRWEHGDINIGALPVVDDSDLVEEPDLQPEDFSDCVTKVTVTYCDRLHGYKEQNSEPAKNGWLVRVLGEPREVTLRRPWITDGDLANRYAAEYAAMRSKPRIPGTIKIKRERAKAKGLHKPGTLFVLNWATRGLSIVMRNREVDWPGADGSVATLSIENERAIWPFLYVPPSAPKPGDFIIEAIAIANANARVVELPTGLKTTPAPEVIVLAQRPSDDVIGYHVHMADDNATFDRVSAANSFAAFGKVVDAIYPEATNDLDTTIGVTVELFGVDSIGTQTATQRDNRELLLFFGKEVASVGQVTAIGDDKLNIHLLRAQFDTRKAAHAIGEKCWFIPRDRLARIEHASFIENATRYFKLQPYTATQELELVEITSFAYTFAAQPRAPFGVKVKSTEKVETSPGVFEQRVTFSWDYGVAQDVANFQLRHRSAAMTDPLPVDWTYQTIAPAGVTVYDIFGVAISKRQSATIVVVSRFNWHIEVRVIDSTGKESPFVGEGRRAVESTSSGGTPEIPQFTSKAALESYDVTDTPTETVVTVTIAGATQWRQLQAGAPEAGDWAVFNQPAMRWRQTAGLSL